MTDLTIGRLSATVGDWPDRDQVPRMLRGLADSRLRDALRTHSLPPGEWCLRRLDVDLVVDPGRPTTALEAEWADQIVIALRRSLRDGSRDVVRYDRREQAVDDLLAGLATGVHERAWAWRQVGVLLDDDPAPGVAPRELAQRVLARLPHGVAAAVHRLVDHVGVVPVHRLLGPPGWAAVAAQAARETGTSVPAVADQPDRLPGATTPPAAGHPGTGAVARASAIAASSTLAAALRSSSLRPDPETLEAWALLVVARSHPSALRRPGAGTLLRAVAEVLRPASRAGLGDPATGHPEATRPAPGSVAPGPAHRDGSPSAPPASSAPAAARPDLRHDSRLGAGSESEPGGATSTDPRPGKMRPEEPEAGHQPQADGEPTPWGGLLFLLNTATEADLLAALDLPPLGDRPQWWLLRELATRLVPASPTDAAVLALSGTAPGEPDDQPAPGRREATALDRCATRWAAVTAARLRGRPPADSDDLEVVVGLARRQARVRREPGWVEVVLDLDTVDLGVRRAGLDLDPGWIWWLGQVVRFRYE